MTRKAYIALCVVGVCFTASNALAQPWNTNMLVNGDAEAGDMSGWTVVLNGGDGWGARLGLQRTGDYCFNTSYAWGTRYQQIDLLAAGFSEAELDAGPVVQFSEWIRARPDAGSEYFITFELLDAAEQVIASWNHGEQNNAIQMPAGTDWFEESYEFQGYGSGMRHVRITDGGKDTVFWAGPYGAHFDDASVSLSDAILSDGDMDDLSVGTRPDCGNNAGAGAWYFGTTYTQGDPNVCEALPEQMTVVETTSFDPGAEGNSIHLLIVADPDTNAHLPNRFNFTIPEGNLVAVTFDIWVVAGGGGGSVYVGGDHGGGGFSNATDRGPQMSWMTDGSIGVNEAGVNNTVVPSYPTDEWQSVRMEIDLVADTFDLFWGPRGGTLDPVGDDLGYRSGLLDHLDRFTYVNYGGLMADANSYLDNVTVTIVGCQDDPCDMNCDGEINAFDIEPFLDLLFGPGVPCGDCTGDVNGDGNIDAFDIEPFLNCLFP